MGNCFIYKNILQKTLHARHDGSYKGNLEKSHFLKKHIEKRKWRHGI